MIKKILILGILIISVFALLATAKKDIVSLAPVTTSVVAIVSPTAIPISTLTPTKTPLISTPTKTPPTPTPIPIITTAKFTTLLPSSPLPSDDECASKVRRSSFEPRPQNYSANNTKASGGPYINDVFRPEKITGNFTGTTDEIIQWGACKWGFDEDIVRAVAVQESFWRMSDVGDNGQSFGLLQIKRTVHENTYPASSISTAFNVDYALSYRRACFEGQHSWIKKKGYSSYSAGDEWGCIGSWFSGKWYDGDVNVPYSGANWYIREVKNHLQDRRWTKPGF